MWPAKFRDNKDGKKWQELQLVATLLATFLISYSGKDVDSVFDLHAAQISEFARTKPRPRKTHNLDQWQYIASVVLGRLHIAGVTPAQLMCRPKSSYAHYCRATLPAACQLNI